MIDGISNFQIEEAFRNINDNDINDNFVGAFPSNHMNEFIDHAFMIPPQPPPPKKRKLFVCSCKQ